MKYICIYRLLTSPKDDLVGVISICVGARVAQWVRWLDYLTIHTSLSPIRRGFAPGFVNHNKGALDSQPLAYQLLGHGRWFSPCTPASSTTINGGNDITELLLKVALNTIN